MSVNGDEVESSDKPLSLMSYEVAVKTRAYVIPTKVGEILYDMPIFLTPNGCVDVPLERSYLEALSIFPPHWAAPLSA